MVEYQDGLGKRKVSAIVRKTMFSDKFLSISNRLKWKVAKVGQT